MLYVFIFFKRACWKIIRQSKIGRPFCFFLCRNCTRLYIKIVENYRSRDLFWISCLCITCRQNTSDNLSATSLVDQTSSSEMSSLSLPTWFFERKQTCAFCRASGDSIVGSKDSWKWNWFTHNLIPHSDPPQFFTLSLFSTVGANSLVIRERSVLRTFSYVWNMMKGR